MTGSPGSVVPDRDGALQDAAAVSLVDLLDRLLGTGVVVSGDVLISLAGIDLVEVRLHALLTTVRSDLRRPAAERELR